ncbi:uncharacterized protein [Solanum tuberosum]|uniref:uncharacterized protein n=1 Tax=Solanum tuberosum TaxID=4113 RepID=UPI00073A2ACB|nr:PREDICTED: uncharacterized protein LOC107061343 [Solanum tuberosum]
MGDQTENVGVVPLGLAGQPTVDTTSPLYVHPSDNLGAMLVLTPFDGIGYRSWRRGVLRSLSVKNKVGFITGECVKPGPTSSQLRQWERCDDMVTSWILNSLTKKIADSVEYVNSSIELWKELDDQYDQINGAKLYQIQKEINDIAQGNLDITTYYTRLKKLWEELCTLNAQGQCTCTCTCGAKDNSHKAEQSRRLIHFLMGLNEVYTVVRGNILMMTPLPSMAQAFLILIQEEKQREFKPNNQHFMESTSLNASSSGASSSRAFKTNYSPATILRGKIMHLVVHLEITIQEGLCNYNSSQDHHQQQPYRSNKGKGKVANVHGQPAVDVSDKGKGLAIQNEDQTVSLTKEEYGQMMHLLRQFQCNDDSDNTHGTTNFTGIVICTSSIDFSKPSCKCYESKVDQWILDSGASNHMTFNKASLTNIKTLPYPMLISLPNGYKVKPPSMKRPQEIGSSRDGLYYLCSKCLKSNRVNSKTNPISSCNCICSSSSSSCLSSSPSLHSVVDLCNKNISLQAAACNESVFLQSALPCSSNETNVDLLWHNRLGPVPFLAVVGDDPGYYCNSVLTHRPSCRPTIPKLHRDKFDPKATPHIFIGYPFATKGYKVLSLATKRLHVSRDVVFPFSLSPNGSSFPAVFKSVSKSAQSADVFIDDVLPSAAPIYDNQRNTSVITSNFGPATIKPPYSHNDVVPKTQPTQPQRRSIRTHKAGTYLLDYVCPTPKAITCSTPLSLSSLFCRHSHIAPDVLALTSQHLVNNVCNDSEPSSFEQAILNLAWQTTMTQEYEALHANHTWDLVPLPEGKKAI